METTATAPEDEKEKSGLTEGIITFLSYFFVLPVFIIFHKILPDPDWPLFLDRVLLATAIFFLIKLLLYVFKPIILVGFVMALLWLTYGSIWGNYGFRGFYNDYRAMIFSMANSPNPEHIAISEIKSFPVKSKVKVAADYDQENVRNFAVNTASKYFIEYQKQPYYNKYRVLIQSFSIFKEINSNWNYVNDPDDKEYFAKASETVNLMAGDCDDHTVFMTACIKAIGGKTRMILTTGHIYPEIYIGDMADLEEINYLIHAELFKEETNGKSLYYHTDEDGGIWLNLDYTGNYPGGKFMADEVEGVIYLDL